MRSQEVLHLQPLRQTTAVFFIVVNLFRNVVNHIRKSKINCQPKSGKDISLSNCRIVKLSKLKMENAISAHY